MKRDELQAMCERCHIPIEAWGTGEAKTLDHLLDEIHEGETIFKEDAGRAVRIVATAGVNVYCTVHLETFVLTEDRQIFSDGRCRRRHLTTSLAEKIKKNKETPEEAAKRAVKEELRIMENLSLIKISTTTREPSASRSFPGLLTINTLHSFEVYLPEHLYNPEGYREEQRDKTTYFIWLPNRKRNS